MSARRIFFGSTRKVQPVEEPLRPGRRGIPGTAI